MSEGEPEFVFGREEDVFSDQGSSRTGESTDIEQDAELERGGETHCVDYMEAEGDEYVEEVIFGRTQIEGNTGVVCEAELAPQPCAVDSTPSKSQDGDTATTAVNINDAQQRPLDSVIRRSSSAVPINVTRGRVEPAHSTCSALVDDEDGDSSSIPIGKRLEQGDGGSAGGPAGSANQDDRNLAEAHDVDNLGMCDGVWAETRAFDADSECETHPTQVDSPGDPPPLCHQAKPSTAAAAPVATSDEHHDHFTVDKDALAAKGHDVLYGEVSAGHGDRGGELLSILQTGLRSAPHSPVCPPAGGAKGCTNSKVGGQPRSPLRRAGRGSSIILTHGASALAGKATASAADDSLSKATMSPLQPQALSLPMNGAAVLRDVSAMTSAKEASSPLSGSAMSFTLSDLVGPAKPAVGSDATSTGVASRVDRDSEGAGQVDGPRAETFADGSNVALTSGGISEGFLSSVEQSARAAVQSSLPLQRFPNKCLDQLNLAADKATSSMSSRPVEAKGGKGHKKNGRQKAIRAGTVTKEKSAAVTPAMKAPKIPSPAKVVPGLGDWIETKNRSSFRGGSATAGGAGRVLNDHRGIGSLESQESSISQNILAIGVPQEREVYGPPPNVSRTAPDPRQGDDSWSHSQSLSQLKESQETRMPAGLAPVLNTQDINPDDCSQIEKNCSQDRREMDRILDEAIAGGLSEGAVGEGRAGESPSNQLSPCPLDGTNSITGAAPAFPKESLPVKNGGQEGLNNTSRGDGGKDGDGGDGRKAFSCKQNKNKANPLETSGKNVARKGSSRTPGTYLVGLGSGANLSARKKIPSPRQSDGNSGNKNVFDIPSDEDNADGDEGVASSCHTPLSKSRPGIQGTPKSTPRRGKGKTKAMDQNLASQTTTTACDEPEDARLASVEDLDDHDEIVASTQDLQTERTMAAIRKHHTSVSFPAPDELEVGSSADEEIDEQRKGEEKTASAASHWPPTVAGKRMTVPGALCHHPPDVGTSRAGANCHRKRHTPQAERPAQTHAGQVASSNFVKGPVSPASEKYKASVASVLEKHHVGAADTTIVNGGILSLANGSNKASPVSVRKKCRRGAAANIAVNDVDPAETEPITFGALLPFLKEEGWECVDGKGLHTWFFLFPGRGGRHGKQGDDYLVSEEAVVEYARLDEELLARFRAYCQDCAANGNYSMGERPSTFGKSKRAKDSRGRDRDSSAVESSRGKQTGGSEASSGSVRQPESYCEKELGATLAAGQSGRKAGQGNTRARRQEGYPSRRASMGEPEWKKQWGVLWQKLKKDGWTWKVGVGLASYHYLKPGVGAKEGVLGVDIFDSEQAVLAYVNGPAAPELGNAYKAGNGEWQHHEMVAGEPRLVEWSLTKHRSKRNIVQPTFPGGSLPPAIPEQVNLPSRDAIWNVADQPQASAIKSRLPAARSTRVCGDQEKFTPGVTSDLVAVGAVTSRTDRGAPAEVDSQVKRKGCGRPPKNSLYKDVGVRPLKRGRMARVEDEPPSRRPYGDVITQRGEGMDDDAGEDALCDESQIDFATQPQYELASAIHMAEVGRGRPPVPSTAPAPASVVTAMSTGGADPKGLGYSSARIEAKGTNMVEIAIETPKRGSSTSAVSPRREANALLSEIPAGRSTPESAATAKARAKNGKPPNAANGRSSTPKSGRKIAAASSAQPAFTPPSKRPIFAAGGGGSGSGRGRGPDRIPSKQEQQPRVSSPPGSASAHSGSGINRRARGSLSAGNAVRSLSRAKGPFSSLAFILTGIRSADQEEMEDKIKNFGGKVVQIFGSKGVLGSSEWERLLLSEARKDGAGSARTDDGRRLVMVAAPASDRTPKFQLALAAGMTIVHPAYVSMCVSQKAALDPTLYLLPLGRSALTGQPLVMPKRSVGGEGRYGGSENESTGERPFKGKTILFFSGEPEKWTFTLKVAGAAVTVLEESGKGKGGDRKNARVAAAGGDESDRCTLKDALHQLRRGGFGYLVGPINSDGAGAGSGLAKDTRTRLVAAATQGGVLSGSLEWAIQCMAHGRLISPAADVCPLFPLGTASDSGRGVGDGDPFYMHRSKGGRRYFAGDYALLNESKRTRNNRQPSCVVRIQSVRPIDGKIAAKVTTMEQYDDESPNILVPGKDREVGSELLDARVLVMTAKEAGATQAYSPYDKGIFTLADSTMYE